MFHFLKIPLNFILGANIGKCLRGGSLFNILNNMFLHTSSKAVELLWNERKANPNPLSTRRKPKPWPQFYEQFWWSPISLLAKAVLWLENGFYQQQVSLIIPAWISPLLIHVSQGRKFCHLHNRGGPEPCEEHKAPVLGNEHRNGLCSPCKIRCTLRSRAWVEPKICQRVRCKRNYFAQLVVGAALLRCTCLFRLPHELFPCQR